MRSIATFAAVAALVALAVLVLRDDGRRDAGASGPPVATAVLPPGERLAQTLADLGRAAFVRFDVKATDGTAMEALDVTATSLLGRPLYLGVAHRRSSGRFVTGLFASDDLRSWRHVRDLVERGSQATIAALPDGGWLLAVEVDEVESDGVRRGHLRFLRYPTVAALEAGDPDWRYDAPRTRSTVAAAFEGTPSLDAVTGTGAEVGFHYLTAGAVDRNAVGTLSGIGTPTPGWTTRPAPAVDEALTRLGVQGNIGDRTNLEFGGTNLTLVEGQRVKRDFSTWSVYLLGPARASARRVAFETPGGSRSFGNAGLSRVELPGGGSGLVLTAFVFTEGAAPGEAGQMLAVFRTDG